MGRCPRGQSQECLPPSASPPAVGARRVPDSPRPEFGQAWQTRTYLGRPRRGFCAHATSVRADDAIELYRNDFLVGLELGELSFDRWADGERTRLRTRFEALLRQGAQGALETGHWDAALSRAEKLTSVAPFDGDAAALEATVLVAGGRTSEALAALRRFAARIKEDLDIPPPQAVRDLTARLERTVAKQGAGRASSGTGSAKPARESVRGARPGAGQTRHDLP